MSARLGLDIGGTFTDAVGVLNGSLVWAKAETTHHDLKDCFMEAAARAAERLGTDLADVARDAEALIYSTTVGTNTLIERTGPKLGLLTTMGFEDTLKVGRSRSWADGMPLEVRFAKGRARKPELLIPRDEFTVSLRERIDSRGQVLIPLDEDEVRGQVQRLVDLGVRGFVIVLLNSFINPEHENRVRDLIHEEYPEVYLGRMPVFLSHEVSPQMGEYRRSLTTIIDAYLRVNTEEHILDIGNDLLDMGYHRPLFLAKCTGGISSVSRTRPVHLLGSGPVAGVFGARALAEAYGLRNVLLTDMGGTSFDAGLIVEARDRLYESDPVFDRWRVQVPVIAHWSIGAGGGSIAYIEDQRLHVGPRSARSRPGPACYGRGGTEPTVTDADVVLGYIDPDYFLGGRIKLDAALAAEAVRICVAEPLGMTVDEAAWHIRHQIDGIMGQELYMRTALNSGSDPREFTAFAVGGAGPVHAAGYAEFADVRRIALPPFAGAFGAFGTLSMDLVQTYEKGRKVVIRMPGSTEFEPAAAAVLNGEIEELLVSARRDIAEEGLDPDAVSFVLELQMSYGMQRQTLDVPHSGLHIDGAADLSDLFDRFQNAYADSFGEGSTSPESGAEVRLVRLNVIGASEKLSLPSFEAASSPASPTGSRRVLWDLERGWEETPVYRLDELGPSAAIDGPALIEAEDSVGAAPRGWSFRLDEHRMGWLEKQT